MDIHFIIHRSYFPEDHKNRLYGSESPLLKEVKKRKQSEMEENKLEERKQEEERQRWLTWARMDEEDRYVHLDTVINSKILWVFN